MQPIALEFHQNIARSRKWDHGALLLAAALAVLAPTWLGAQTTVDGLTRWRTYLGGTEDDRVRAIATDPFGHVYVAGRTTGGLLLGNDTTGQSGLTHQAAFGGGPSDAFLAKFAPQGSMLWCTYFGGQGEDEAVAIVVTGLSGAYLVGHTFSDEGIATDPCLQPMRGGGSDVFVAHFTEHGLLLGATYFGGADDEMAASAALGHDGRLAACGSSTGPGSFATNVAPVQGWSGAMDGILAVFHSIDSLAAGTYIGGAGDDALVQLTSGDADGFVLLGNTTSSSGIASPDAMTATAQGGVDAFVMRIDTDLVVTHGTYFGGPQEDRASGIARHGGRIAICGTTFSDTLYTDSTSYRPANAGAGDGFLAVLDEGLQLSWSTFIGDSAEDGLAATAFDLAGRLYATGFTRSGAGITADSLDWDTLHGPSDAFVLRSDSAQSIRWSRYLGAMGEEEAHALCIKDNTAVYAGGRTSSISAFAVLGHQMDFGGGDHDGFLTRLDQIGSSICEGICTGTSTGYGSGGGSCNGVSSPLLQYDVCLGGSVTFIAFGGALGIAAEWMWYADECGVPDHFLTSGDTITITPTESFILCVRAESTHDTTACSYLPVIVHAFPQPVVAVSDTVCTGAQVLMEGTGAEAFEWAVADTTLVGSPAVFVPMAPGLLDVLAIATNGPGCSVEVMEQVVVLPEPVPQWAVADVTCVGGTDGIIALDTLGAEALSVAWTPDAITGPLVLGLSPGAYIATVTDVHGCSRTDTLLIATPPPLMDSVSVADALCGEAVGSAQVNTSSASEGLAFDWGNGPVASTAISGLAPGVHLVMASDSAGCQQQISFIIAAIGSIAIAIGPDTVIAENGETVLGCAVFPFDSLATFQWTPEAGLDDPEAATTACFVASATTYIITVTSSSGCIATDSVVVMPFIVPSPIAPTPCGEVFLPNIFSPNGDGLNDALCVMGGCFTGFALNVYDRWGQRMYESNDPDACWDGRLHGQPLPIGAYAFTLAAVRSNGEAVERSGTITLRR